MGRRSPLLVGIILAVALLPSAWLAWHFRAMPQLGAYHDDAVYLESGKALAGHDGYRILSLPDQPFQTKYPPVFPLLLSVIWRIDPNFPENLPKFTALCWSLLPIYVYLMFQVLRQWGLDKIAATAICALAALSPHLVLSSLMTMSDLAFGVLLLVAILLLERGMTKPSPAIFALAGAAGGIGFLTRTQGIALMVSAAGYLIWRKRWIDAAVFSCVFGTAIAGWFLWTRQHAYPGTDPVAVYYVDYVRFYRLSIHWSDIPMFVQTNLDSMFMGATRLMFADVGYTTPARMFAWVIAIGTISGLVRIAKQSGRMHFALFGLVSFVMLIPWTGPPNERFLLGLWPAIAVGLFVELSHLYDLCRINWRKSDLPSRAVAACMFATGVAVCAAIPYGNLEGVLFDLPSTLADYQRISEQRRPGYAFLRDHTPADATVLTYDDPLMYLYTGRTGYAMPILHWVSYSENLKRTTAYFKTTSDFMVEHHLDYALVTSGDFRRDLHEDGRIAITEALNDTSVFEPSFASSGTEVFKLRDPLHAGIQRPGSWWAGVRDSIPAVQ